MRRTGAAFFLGDAAFLSDGRFRQLARRLSDPDDFNSAVGAWFVALAAARRNGRPELDVETETGSRFLDDLRAVGLLTDTGFRHESFAAWSPGAPQQAYAGTIRAAGAQRIAGRFAPADASGASVTSALESPTSLISNQITSIPTSSEEGVQGEDHDSQDRYHELTGYRPWGIWSGEKLLAAERDYGRARVIAALDAEQDSGRDNILSRTLARLARDADKLRQGRVSKPRKRTTPEDRDRAERDRIALVQEWTAAVKDMPA